MPPPREERKEKRDDDIRDRPSPRCYGLPKVKTKDMTWSTLELCVWLFRCIGTGPICGIERPLLYVPGAVGFVDGSGVVQCAVLG